MKKHLLMAFATFSLVACVQEEVVNVPQTDAITFDQAYIDNATRTAADPSTTTASIAAFDVWAFMNEWDGTVLTDEDVTRTSTGWTYANTQYWTPLNKYYFAALAPMNSANVKETLATSNETAKLGLGEVEFTNVDGSEDLLYAATMVQAPRYEDLKLNNMPPVNFKFSHLLSKVKFTFTNGFKTDNAFVEVLDIVMKAPKTGTIDLAVENWWDNDDWQLGTETVDLEFGDVAKLAMGSNDECAKERLSIPAEADQVYDITFTVKLYMGDQLALETVKTSSVTGVPFEMGKAYNLTAEINPDNLELPSIEFDVVVKDWDEPTIDVAHPIVATLDGVGYSSLQEAIDAVTESKTVYLVSSVNEDVTIVQKEGINLVVDGQDNKFDGVITINGNARSTGAETLTIKNVNFKSNKKDFTFITAPSKINNKYNYSHNVTIEDCTFTADQTVGSANFNTTYNFVMKGCTATNMHSLLQLQSVDNTALVEDVTVVNCKNGISFGNTAFPTLKNADIAATGYGVRLDGNADRGALVAENVTIDANRPIIVRKAIKPYSVTVNGTANITAGDGYDVIFTTGDDEGVLSAPAAANVNYNGPATLSVYPGYSDTENTYVATADALQEALEEVVAGTEDKNIVLSGDIDLASLMTRSAVVSNWTPIGNEDAVFTGVFDGNGHTIKNLNLVYTEPSYFIGFFGCAENATIKNVTFENVYVNVASDDTNEGGHIAAVAGYAQNVTFENITVKGDVIVESNFDKNASSRVAVVAGGNYGGKAVMKNVKVEANEDSYVKANNCVGGLAGQLQVEAVFENCSSNIDVIGYKFFAGGIVGLTAGNSTFTNCHTTGDVTITNGRAGNANDLYRVGGIAGGWDDNVYTPLIVNGCSYEGTVSGQDANGKVAETLDCAGYVGRGYSTKVGTTVSIDGTQYIYAGNGVFHHVGAIVEVDGQKAIVYSVDNGVKAVSVEQGGEMTWDESMAWAQSLGEGWSLTTLDELKAIYNVRFELNQALAADSAENVLFEEDHKEEDGTYAAYWTSTPVENSTTKAYYFYFDSKGRETTSFKMFPVEYSRAVCTLM